MHMGHRMIEQALVAGLAGIVVGVIVGLMLAALALHGRDK